MSPFAADNLVLLGLISGMKEKSVYLPEKCDKCKKKIL